MAGLRHDVKPQQLERRVLLTETSEVSRVVIFGFLTFRFCFLFLFFAGAAGSLGSLQVGGTVLAAVFIHFLTILAVGVFGAEFAFVILGSLFIDLSLFFIRTCAVSPTDLVVRPRRTVFLLAFKRSLPLQLLCG